MSQRACAACSEVFDLSAFSCGVRKRGKNAGASYTASYCKPCAAAYARRTRNLDIVDPEKALLLIATKARGRAMNTKRRVAGNLSQAYLVQLWRSQNGRCAVTGITLPVRKSPLSPFTPSLDRINNDIGYIEGNVRWVLYGVNALKGTGTDADVFSIAKAIVENQRLS